jgi:large subunit ribosomal protein L30
MAKLPLKMQLVRSPIGCRKKHRQTLIGLGFRNKLHSFSEVEDNPSTRGMLQKVGYLVRVVKE